MSLDLINENEKLQNVTNLATLGSVFLLIFNILFDLFATKEANMFYRYYMALFLASSFLFILSSLILMFFYIFNKNKYKNIAMTYINYLILFSIFFAIIGIIIFIINYIFILGFILV